MPPITCPKCAGTMAPVTFETVEVDRCAACGGIFFDVTELAALRRHREAAALDVGDAETGRTHDAAGVIRCPRDAQPMTRMVDLEQPHVWLEQCPHCGGTFLDAGELRDLTERTLREWLFRTVRERKL